MLDYKKSARGAVGLVFLAATLCLGLVGCTANRPSVIPVQAPAEEKDSGPDQDIDVSDIPDAIPRSELVRLAGNKTPYTVLGKTYYVNLDSKEYSETGYASWYGKKFHGRKTSNGEVYDMFGMTAAHKTLPIPSYVKVTNLANRKSIIVRVNDRGPFHDGRIIDLSYTAAKKLGFHQQGTAKVHVELINPTGPSVANAGPSAGTAGGMKLAGNTFLQAGAFSRREGAEALRDRLSSLLHFDIRVVSDTGRQLHKVLIGPVVYQDDLLNLRRALLEANLGESYVVEL